MANWWDALPDAPGPAPAAQPAPSDAGGGNWWDSLPAAPETPTAAAQRQQEVSPSTARVVGNVGAGFSDAIAHTLGGLPDLVAAGYNAIRPQGMPGQEAPAITEPVGGSETWKRLFGLFGANPDETPQLNDIERMARAGGRLSGDTLMALAGARAFSGGMRLPDRLGGAEIRAPVAPNPANVAQNVVGKLAEAPLPAATAAGFAGGVTGEAAREAAPEPYKPFAELGGQLVGGGLSSLAEAGLARARASAPWLATKSYFTPMTEGGQQRLAGQKIISAASDPEAFNAALANNDGELVPGSKPTTFQQTNDTGIGQLDRTSRTRNAGPFADRAVEQNEARNAAVEGLQPAGNPESVGGFFRQQLKNIDDVWSGAESAVRGAVAKRTNALGGLDQPQEYSAAMRGSVEDANKAAKAAENRLWQAINPDGKAGLNVSGLKSDIEGIATKIDPAAEQPSGREAGVIQAVGNWGDLASLNSVRALRSRISDAISREVREGGTTESPVVRRLTMYKNAVDDHLTQAVERQDAFEQQAVAAGQMAPEATLQGWVQNQVANWQANRAAQARTGTNPGTGAGFDSGAGTSGVSGVDRAASAPRGGSGGAPGNQGVSGEALRPLTQDELARYGEARQATATRKETFRRGPVGEILRPGDNAGFRVPESQAGSKIFRPGPRGAETVRAYLEAQGAPEAVQGHAVASLRSEGIIRPDGTIDAGKFAAWRQRYNGAVGETPELHSKFADVQAAQETLDQTMAAHARMTRDFENSAARNFLKDDPVVAVRKAFGSGNSAETFKSLVDMTKSSPEATAGLKRAVVQYVQENMRNAGADLYKPEVFQKFIRSNSKALRTLFGGEGLNTIEMVAADIRRAMRSTKGGTLGSDTQQNAALAEKHGEGKHSFLGNMIMLSVSESAAHAAVQGVGEHGVMGAIGASILGAAPLVANAMRQSGLRSVNDLVDRAMLDPALARELVAKVPAKPFALYQRRLAARILGNAGATTPGLALDRQ